MDLKPRIVWVVYDPFGTPQFSHEEQRKAAEWILDQHYDVAVGRAGGYRCKLWCPQAGDEEPPKLTSTQARRKQVDLDKILKPKEEHEGR